MNVKILNTKIDEFVSYTMSFLNNIQVFHWQTQSYAEHQALGEYYESLTDLNDKLVESWQGNQNTRLKFSEGPYSLQNYVAKEETKKMLKEFANIIKDKPVKIVIRTFFSKKEKNFDKYKKISKSRSLYIRAFLINQGISHNRIKIETNEENVTKNWKNEVILNFIGV